MPPHELPPRPASLTAAEGAVIPPAFATLCSRLRVGPFEQNVLMLVLARELHTRTGALCAAVQSRLFGAPLQDPTFALAVALFDQPNWGPLSPDGALRFWRLVSCPTNVPLLTAPLKVDERILAFVKGIATIDPRVASLVSPMPQPTSDLPISQSRIVEVLASMLSDTGPQTLVLTGRHSAAKRTVAGACAARLGLDLYELIADALPQHGSEAAEFAALWRRETLLSPLALYFDASRVDGHARAPLRRLLHQQPGIIFIDSRETWTVPGLDIRSIQVEKPNRSEQRALWLAAGADADTAVMLASQFDVDTADINAITGQATSGADIGAVRSIKLREAALQRSRPDFNGLGEAIPCSAGWGDLILPEHETALLHQLADQVRFYVKVNEEWGFAERSRRGLGITALFSGGSGTGKTLAAEVIANELNLHLCRIDLAGVISKYIGETEKNLRSCFDAADEGGCILLFDEADALFGKRMEVRDSHDRYANIEVDYLLQRMEAFRGLAILATNQKSALDVAFLRRLRFVIDFPFPNAELRRAIWQAAFPARVPLDSLNFDRLARLNLAGGNIRSIALNAAFLAARADQAVTMPLIFEAARAELRKLDRPFSESDFVWREAEAAA